MAVSIKKGIGIWLFVAGLILVSPVLAVLMIQVPSLQQYLKEQVAGYITRQTDMETSVGNIRFILPFYYRIDDIVIRDHHKAVMFRSGSLSAYLGSVDLRNRVIRIARIGLKDIYLHHKHYKGEDTDNLSLFIERLNLTDTLEKEPLTDPFIIRISHVKLKNGTYKTHLQEKHNQMPGIDFYHLDISEAYTDISNIAIKGEIVSLRVNSLQCYEHTGFRIIDLNGYADISSTSIRLRSMTLETNQSAVALDLGFHYPSFEAFRDFEEKVFIRGYIRPTTLATYDLGFFVPPFFRTNNLLSLTGEVAGFVNNFKTRRFQFSTGSTSFDGDIVMQGLPDFNNTYINLDINHFIANPEDIQRFHLYDRSGIISIPLPDAVKNMGIVSVTGNFDGLVNDFYSNATFTGGFGFVKADMHLSTSGNNFYVEGELGIQQVNGGTLLNYPDLGLVNMDATVSGSGTLKTWDMDIESRVHSLDFRNYLYEDITISGKVVDRMFTGIVDVDDKNIALNFNGILDFNSEVPSYNFTADIRNANLAKIGLISDSLRGLLSTRMSIDIQGNHPDNIAGLVNIDFAQFITPTKTYLLDHLDMSAFSSPESRRKFIAIRSDYINGDIYGNFNYTEIENAMKQYMANYISGVIETDRSISEDTMAARQNDLHFDLVFRNTGHLTELFTGTRIETSHLSLNGSFLSSQNKLRVTGMSERVEINGQRTDNWYLNLYEGASGVVIETGARQFFLNDTLGIFEPYCEGIISNNLVRNTLSWKFDPSSTVTDAIIRSSFNLKEYPDFRLTFTDGSVVVKDTLWQIRDGSGLSYINKILDINNIVFSSHGQSIRINGRASENPDHFIECNFQEVDLSWIDFLTVPSQVNLDGIINGNINIRNLWDHPRILADLQVEDFVFNEDPLGSLKLITLWDDQVKGMRMAADFIYQGNIGSKKTAGITGYIFPLKEAGDNFDLSFDLDNFRINILSTFLSDISTDIRGFASGMVKLTGTFTEPVLTGKIKVNARNMLIDYLNTWYSFADTLTFTKNAILFNNIRLSDNNRINSRDSYSAVLSGSIGHKGFRDFSLNLNIKAENFTFLNTNGHQDPMYYGRALATGNVSITGPVEDIMIRVQARTERFTVLEIPLISPAEVSRSSFITFIDHREDVVEIPKQSRQTDHSNLRLNFNLQVTPDATVRLIFDPLVGDVIEGNGSGNLDMNIDSQGEFELKGQYIIARGDYTFNLENLISKKFNVRNGGTIRWTGDPYDAIIDIEAVYRTKASLTPLNMEDSALSAQNVDCIIHMTGKLFNPDIAFRIEFPDLNTFDNEKYQALAKPNLNYHFLSLLAISRFVNTQSQQFLEGGSSANIAGANTSEILANQLSVWLSNISDEFDVDFAYHPGTGLTPEQVEAAFKTQVLNDRLTIESKVGIGGKTYAGNTQKTSNMVGDIIAEYRIDREGRFRVKAFNQYNEQNILYEGAPYTQGVGVFYRKEFHSFRDLFRKRKQGQE